MAGWRVKTFTELENLLWETCTYGRIAHLVEQHWHLNCRISFRKLSPDYGILYMKLAHSAGNLRIWPRSGISNGKLFWPSEFPVHWQHWLLNYRISFGKLSHMLKFNGSSTLPSSSHVVIRAVPSSCFCSCPKFYNPVKVSERKFCNSGANVASERP